MLWLQKPFLSGSTSGPVHLAVHHGCSGLLPASSCGSVSSGLVAVAAVLGCVLHWPDLPSLCHGPWKPAPCKPVGLCPSLTSKGILCYQKYYLIWPRLRVPKESKYQRKIKTIFGQSFLGHSCFPRPRSWTLCVRQRTLSLDHGSCKTSLGTSSSNRSRCSTLWALVGGLAT